MDFCIYFPELLSGQLTIIMPILRMRKRMFEKPSPRDTPLEVVGWAWKPGELSPQVALVTAGCMLQCGQCAL